MKRIIVVAVLVLAGLASAQAWDVEVGRAYSLADPVAAVSEHELGVGAWYGTVRYDMPLTSEVLGAQLWLLPEVGVWVPDLAPYYGYGRLQLLLDQTYGTFFADVRARLGAWPATTLRYQLRLGIRFGWPAEK